MAQNKFIMLTTREVDSKGKKGDSHKYIVNLDEIVSFYPNPFDGIGSCFRRKGEDNYATPHECKETIDEIFESINKNYSEDL